MAIREIVARGPPGRILSEPETVKQFLSKYAIGEEEEVLEDAVTRLANGGLKQTWQVVHAPKEVLLHLIPPTEAGRALTAVMCAQTSAAAKSKSESPVCDDLRKAAKEQLKAAEKQKKAVKKDRRRYDSESSSSSRAKSPFGAARALSRYGLSGMSHLHGVEYYELKKLLKEHKRAAKHDKEFLCPGDLRQYSPQWMQQNDKPQKRMEQTHAQWLRVGGPAL